MSTALLVIDMQRDFCAPGGYADRAGLDLADLPAPKRRRAAKAGAPIGQPGPLGRLLVRGEYGHDLIDELRPADGEPVIDKPGYSAFAATDLDLLLRNRGVTDLVITGVTTEVCVSSTLRSAVDLGYACTLVGDGCGSAYPELHAAALAMVAVEGGLFGRVLGSHALLDAWEAA